MFDVAQVNVEGLEKERDFYFGKLRDIEVMCQEGEENNPLIQRILEVLYATEVNTIKGENLVCLLNCIVSGRFRSPRRNRRPPRGRR